MNQHFNGWQEPKENWSKLPHEFIDVLNTVETIGELKVILYILRHTWGYHDDEKKITLDEFENGRKRRDGSRLDGGTGLSRPTVLSGLSKAEAHGFINIETDTSDKARVKKFYSLSNQGLKNFTPAVKELYPNGKEPLPRTEKDTLEINLSEETITTSPLIAAYEQAFGTITYKAQQTLFDDDETYGTQAVIEAIGIAKERGAKSYAYAAKVLEGKANESKQASHGDELFDKFAEAARRKSLDGLTSNEVTMFRKLGGASKFREVKMGFELDQLRKQVYSYVQ